MEVNDRPADSKSGFQSYINQYNCQYPAIWSNDGGAGIASALGQGVVGNLKFVIRPDKSYVNSGSVPSTIEPHECNPDPNVKVSYPNGGESLEQNKEYEITWKSHKITGNVKIELLKNGVVNTVISNDEANDGKYLWNIETDIDLGTNYKIKVTSLFNPSLSDESDAAFSIIEEFIPDYFLMPSGTGNVISVIDTLFYDDGIDTGDYSANFSGEVVLKPGEANKKVKIEFLSFNIEDSSSGKIWDTLNIYHGEGTNNLAGRWFGNNSPGTITSNSNDGALTITFNSDQATEGAGWRAHITLETITSVFVTENSNKPMEISFSNGRVLYHIPYDNHERVKIDLYSVNGVKVGTLVNTNKQKGFYSKPLSDLNKSIAKGVYILKMESGEYQNRLPIIIK